MQPRNVDELEKGIFANLRHDVPAGLVVSLVALPLGLGIALASGAPLVAGVMTGIVAGLMVAWFSGNEVSISGPAAGLVLITASGIRTLGSYEAFLMAVVISGCLQALLGIFRAGVLGAMFPSSVVRGMLSAIGIIIILKQLPHGLGTDHDFEGDEGFFEVFTRENTFSELAKAVTAVETGPFLLFIVPLAIMVLYEWGFWRRRLLFRVLPAPLLALGVGVTMNMLFGRYFPHLKALAENGHLVNLPAAGMAGLREAVTFPALSALANIEVYKVALGIALVGSIETLLCMEATERLDPFRRISSPNRELAAQGLGNFFCGLIGALPMTAVVIRSSTNVYAGARTRFASVTHGVMLLCFVALIPHVLNKIPLASLAAILIPVAYRLTKVSVFVQVYRAGRDQFVPFMVTLVAIVFSDLLTGVLIGMTVGMLMVIKSNYHSAVTVVSEGKNYLFKFTKDVSFVNKARLKRELSLVPSGSSVLIDGTRAMFIDHDILEVVHDFCETARHAHIKVELRNLDSKQYPTGKKFIRG